MTKYLVKFGTDSAEIVAATHDDAWAAFCSQYPVALKHPNLYPREITEVVVKAPAESVPLVEHVHEAEVHVEFVEPKPAKSAKHAG